MHRRARRSAQPLDGAEGTSTLSQSERTGLVGMKKFVAYSVPLGVLLAVAWLWISTGDPVGAFLSLAVLVLALALLVGVVGYVVSNVPDWWRRVRGVSWPDHLLQLEKSGKAAREHYRVLRALAFEDHTCGSLMHLLDIGENRILCLYGQQYYVFEPIDDDPESNQPRRFPTVTFSLLRDKKRREVLEIVPGSTILEPIVCEPIVDRERLSHLGVKFQDGDIISGVSLDAAERLLRPRT